MERWGCENRGNLEGWISSKGCGNSVPRRRCEAHESLMTKAEVKKSQEATASRFGGVPERFVSVATRRNWTARGKSRAF
ncbi:hypothetical protein V1477_020298 [Vespula maculifrons]|uniref:Uncharacterized protein n=1 Tax=Vespula maculifrons TaxID=7453 RepID=A0ABD2ALI5_VESMC